MDLQAAKKTIRQVAVEEVRLFTSIPHRRKAKEYTTFTEGEFWECQQRMLLRIHDFSIRNVPYYRDQPERFPPISGAPTTIQGILERIPILSKQTVKNDTEAFWAQRHNPFIVEHTTGGTTGGARLRVRQSLGFLGHTQAILEEFYRQNLGIRRPRVLRLTGYISNLESDRRVYQIVPGTNVAYLSIYALSDKNKGVVKDFLTKYRPQLIHGYPSSIYELAKLVADCGWRRSEHEHLAVVSTAETLSNSHRQAIEASFNCRVFNQYGSQENQHLVLECQNGSMHIHPAQGIVEILKLDRDEPADVGELGRVIVTGLSNKAMPLLRYDIGDQAISTGYSATCACGLGWPTIGEVVGRIEDLMRTRDGRRFRLMSLGAASGIQESQIVQTGYEKFIFRAVLGGLAQSEIPATEERIVRELSTRIGAPAVVEFQYVDALPRTASGKLRAVVVDFDEDASRR